MIAISGQRNTEEKDALRRSRNRLVVVAAPVTCRERFRRIGPLFTPREIPLDLLFFRRIFSCLFKEWGDENGEVPISVYTRSVVRLYKVLGIPQEFDAAEYDLDFSGAVGWTEFVSCWKKSKVCFRLSWAERVYFATEDPNGCFIGKVFNWCMTALIAFSCLCFIISTLPSMQIQDCARCEPRQLDLFASLEDVCIGVFTFEYFIRVSTAPFSRSELLEQAAILRVVTSREEVVRRTALERLLRFVFSPMNMIDIAIILPYYAEAVLQVGSGGNLTVLRVLRLTRLFRLIKLGGTLEAMQIIGRVLKQSSRMFSVLFVYLLLGLCFSSASVFFAEAGDWDESKQEYIVESHDGVLSATKFLSIPHSMWWCVVTFTTVGYGDMVPVTLVGKFVASATMILGILVLAMPISVIASSFSQVWAEYDIESAVEKQIKDHDKESVKRALSSMECMTKLVIEVFDDRIGREESELLGSVEILDLPVGSNTVESEERVMTLEPNFARGCHTASGSVHFLIRWMPAVPLPVASDTKGSRTRGTLDVRLLRVDGLPRSDWKKQGLRDAYAVFHCWPTPPVTLQDEHFSSAKHRTQTVKASCDPEWLETFSFDYDWPPDWDLKQAAPAPEMLAFSTRKPSEDRAAKRMHDGPGLGTATVESLLDLKKVVEEQCRVVKQLASSITETEALLQAALNKSTARSAGMNRSRTLGVL